jgi:copper chaperone
MTTIKVKGMTCQHCVMAVKKALADIGDIENVEVNLDSGEVSFVAAQSVDLNAVKDRIKKAGYEVV